MFSRYIVYRRCKASFLLSMAALIALLLCLATAAMADDATGKDLQFSNPLDGATIREVVPVQLPRASLPADGGYVSIYIDDVFRLATALADNSDTIWAWDTKAPFTPANSDVPVYTKDGDHTLMIKIFDHANQIYGTATAKVHVINNISSQNLQDGVKLIYRWSKYPDQEFTRTTKLESNLSASGLPSQTIQTSKIDFVRTSEDDGTGEDTYRIVDKVNPGGIIYGATTAAYVEAAYNLKGKSRTVNDYGLTIRNEMPISAGSHFGFDVAQFSPRRVQVGDSWETQIPIMLQWAVEKPTSVRGSAHLDAFEWEDHFPTAKIVETYEGPATLNIDSATAVAPIVNANVKLTRTVWFAYGLGRVVRETTDMKVDGNLTADQVAALGVAGLGAAPAAAPTSNPGQASNPFAPANGLNGAGNFGPTPGASQNTGQAYSEMSFHSTENMVAEIKTD